MTNQRAWSYIRFSTPGQALGDSKRRQLDLAVKYAKQNDLTLSTEPYFDKGVSGFKGKNASEGALKRFLDEVDAGRIPAGSTLLVEALDRITRTQVDHALELFLSIIRRGITIVTLKDNQVYSSARIQQDKGMSLIISLTQLILAHEESSQKAARIRASWEGRRQSGKIITSVCPPWLKVNEDKTAFVELHEQVATVKRIYSLALSGWGVQMMAKAFNKEGVPRLKNAAEWRAQEFVRILKWEATKGTLVGKDPVTLKETHRIENYYPAIIDPKDWALVQQGMEQRRDREYGNQGRKGETVTNLFNRLMRCGVCGSGIRTTSRDRISLRCLKAYAGGNCDTPRFDLNSIEESVLTTLLHVEHRYIGPPSAQSADPRAAMRAELEDKQRRYERYLDEFETVGNTRPVKLRMEKLSHDIEAMEQDLARWTPPVQAGAAWENAFALFQEMRRADEAWPEKRRIEMLRAVRIKLQAGLKLLITRMILLPRLYRSQPPTDYILRPIRFYRKVEVFGPIVELLKKSQNEYEFTADGVMLEYDLPSYGSANYYREKEFEEQGLKDIAALEKKHGIVTGVTEVQEFAEAKPKRKRKSLAG